MGSSVASCGGGDGGDGGGGSSIQDGPRRKGNMLEKWRWQEGEQLQGAFQVHNTEAELCGVRT